MIKKQHGPALVRRLIPMTECPSCAGKGVIIGLLHELDCIGCHSSGFVHAQTLEPLLVEDLVVQLGRVVRRVRSQSGSSPAIGGAQDQYQTNNRRGAGGSNFTGD
jgi:DnaJ-class molecular chaperone